MPCIIAPATASAAPIKAAASALGRRRLHNDLMLRQFRLKMKYRVPNRSQSDVRGSDRNRKANGKN